MRTGLCSCGRKHGHNTDNDDVFLSVRERDGKNRSRQSNVESRDWTWGESNPRRSYLKNLGTSKDLMSWKGTRVPDLVTTQRFQNWARQPAKALALWVELGHLSCCVHHQNFRSRSFATYFKKCNLKLPGKQSTILGWLNFKFEMLPGNERTVHAMSIKNWKVPCITLRNWLSWVSLS